MPDPALVALAEKVERWLAAKPEYFVTHPAELRAVHTLPSDELNQFAADRGWRVVRRVGGRQIEFYRDVTAQQERSGEQPPALRG